MEFDARYLDGIRLFNEREFFACHDELEDLWTETVGDERDFYQGLIQSAVALFHFENGNFGGARRMYESARGYLMPYLPMNCGLDVAAFLDDMRVCFGPLLVSDTEYPSEAVLDENLIPVITVVPGEGTD